MNDNYFYAGYFLGYYTPENCPRYLRKEHYEKMKSELKVRALALLCTVLYCDVMHCAVMYCRTLHCIALYCVWHAILSTWKISCLVVW